MGLRIKVLDEKPVSEGVLKKLAEICELSLIKADSMEWFKDPKNFFSTYVPNQKNLIFIRTGGSFDGLKMARELRQLDSEARFVFFSKKDEQVLNSYELHPIDYLIEPVDPKRLLAAVLRYSI